MANITAQMVKELREATGVGMMDCKKALVESDGDVKKATELLQIKGLAKAAKRSGRKVSEGYIGTYLHHDGKTAILVEVNCETDFVANTDEYKNLVASIARHIAACKPADMDALMAQTFTGTDKTVKDVITEAIAKIGEKVDLRRFTVYEYGDHTLGHYIHGAGKIGVMVELEGGDEEVAKHVAMQIAAAAPSWLDRTQVPQDVLDHEKEVLSEQARNEGKPEKIIEKMVIGRLQKFYKENCLVDQEFVMDNEKTISGLLKEHGAKALRFVRYQLGEGIEKKKEDFAAEVQSFMNK